MKKRLLFRCFAVIMSLSIALSVSGCGNGGTSSDDQLKLNYGNDVLDDITDDDDFVTIQTEGGSGGSGNTAATYDDNLERKFQIDENAKKDFLESVPDNLSGQEVTILVWWNPLEYEKKKMEKFTEETGIEIKWVYADIDSYVQRLASFRAQGNAPDIACIRVQDYPTSILQDFFRPLSESKLDLSKTDVFDIDSMNLLKWDGEYYGALVKGTTYITMGLLLYNADLFDKHGVTSPHKLWQDGKWDWNTFLSTAQEIQQKSGVVACTAEYQAYRLTQTCGEDAVAIKDGRLVNNMASKNYRDAYKWIADLIPTGQYKVMDYGINRGGFKDGNSAMMVEENWALQKNDTYSNISFTLGYAPLPCPTTETVVPSDAQLWGFPTGSKHLEAASYALEYWQNPVYNETGAEIWMNDSVASFMDWLWEQPKTFKISQGVINYGGDYDWYTYNYDVGSNKANVDSAMDRWSAVVDANLKKIYSEFGS